MSLEDRVNDQESRGFIKKALKIGFLGAAAIGTTMLGMATMGIAAPIVSAAFAGGGLIGGLYNKYKGNGESFYKLTTDFLKTYSGVNTVLYPMTLLASATYPAVGAFGSSVAGPVGEFIAKSVYALTGYNWAFVASFRSAGHLLDNYLNPNGITKTISDNFLPFANRVAWGFSPFYIGAAYGISDFLMTGGLLNSLATIPYFAPGALAVGIYNAIKPPGKS